MRKTVMKEIEEITCDFCGVYLNESNHGYWHVCVDSNQNTVGQYGDGYKNTGDWCKDCAQVIAGYIILQLEEIGLTERHSVDHSGANATVESYKKLMESLGVTAVLNSE